MKNQQAFQRYYSRLAREGLVKASICGLIVGFAASIIASIISLFQNYNSVFLALLVALGVAIISTPVIFYFFFRPDAKRIAERIDREGLEERLITMMELENSDSYMAKRQREDAEEQLDKFSKDNLRIRLTKKPLIVLAAVFLCSILMIIITAVNVDPKMAWVKAESSQDPEIVRVPDPEFDYYSVDYTALPGGYIVGFAYQVVVQGEDALAVVAVAYEGYAFVDWFDGYKKAERWDRNVSEDLIEVANFSPKGEGEDGTDDNDDTEEVPDPNNDDYEEKKEFDPDLIINGLTKYYEPGIFDVYMQQMIEYMSSGRQIPPDLENFINIYFDTLKALAEKSN